MVANEDVARTRESVLASRRAIARLLASLERANQAIHNSQELIRKSEALLLMYPPTPQPLISPGQEIECWRFAAAVFQILKEAGYGCQFSSPDQLH